MATTVRRDYSIEGTPPPPPPPPPPSPFGCGPHYRPYDNYVGTLDTALVALDSGITTIVDNSHNSRTSEHSAPPVKALIEASHGLPRRCHRHAYANPGRSKWWPEPAHARLSAEDRFCGAPVARITMIR